ncbi:MAG: TolC family protein [Muribaculaceae bacterium]|nr:TolC family protein [Muribaculaceae bacterium]
MRKALTIVLAMWLTMTAAAQVTLDSCRHMALRNNKQMAVEQLKIEQAGYQRKQAEAAYKPSIDFAGTYLHTGRNISLVDINNITPTQFLNPSTGNYDFTLEALGGLGISVDGKYVNAATQRVKDALTFDAKNVFAAGVLVTQPIYMGGKIKAMNQITRYAEQIAQRLHDRKAEDVVCEVDQAYWLVVSLKSKERLAQSYLDLVTRLDNDVKKMLEQGVATNATLLSVDVKVNEANVALTKVRNGLVLARMALAQLCGEPLDEPMILADELRGDLDVPLQPRAIDMAQVYERRNDFNALELGVKVFDEKAKVARSEMLPTVAAVGSVFTSNPHVYNGFKKEFGFNYAIGAIVKIPLWHWGGLSNKYKAALVDAKIKHLEMEEAKEKIELQVTQANFKYQEAFKTYEATKANLAQADENLRVAQLAFREGMATSDEVLTAQTAWLMAHSEKIDAEIDIMMCNVYLSKVTGNLKY